MMGAKAGQIWTQNGSQQPETIATKHLNATYNMHHASYNTVDFKNDAYDMQHII